MIDLPTWVNHEAWAAFCEMRSLKGKRAPFTVLAAHRLVYELDRLRGQGFNPTEVIWQSVVNGWSGFYELRRRHLIPPGREEFTQEPLEVVDPVRKAEVSEMLKQARRNLTRH